MKRLRLRGVIIGCCACGAHFRQGQLGLLESHITPASSPAHSWTFVRDITIKE